MPARPQHYGRQEGSDSDRAQGHEGGLPHGRGERLLSGDLVEKAVGRRDTRRRCTAAEGQITDDPLRHLGVEARVLQQAPVDVTDARRDERSDDREREELAELYRHRVSPRDEAAAGTGRRAEGQVERDRRDH